MKIETGFNSAKEKQTLIYKIGVFGIFGKSVIFYLAIDMKK